MEQKKVLQFGWENCALKYFVIFCVSVIVFDLTQFFLPKMSLVWYAVYILSGNAILIFLFVRKVVKIS